jgi:hypothetical protein
MHCGVICLHRHSWLQVAHFVKDVPNVDAFLRIYK